jgi:formylglycine-generating enzyme required for sulfatase activity
MSRLRFSHCAAVLAALAIASTASATVTIDWVTVGDPGNPADTDVMLIDGTSGYGSVASVYRISKYEVTNAQYTEFLNAKAASDSLGLYNTSMASLGGITRSGSPGSSTYSTIVGRENEPVNYVSFYDSLRFANWLHNGQGSGDTETRAYTLLGGTPTPSNGPTVTRNAGASIFLPSEDQWYKAAYYDAVSMSYNPYPFADGFNGAVCEGPVGTTSHSANCNVPMGDSTDVGAYTTSPSDYGTFDQGGNVWEWNEAIVSAFSRSARGGNWADVPDFLAASWRGHSNPDIGWQVIGFRVASVPEPSTARRLSLRHPGCNQGTPQAQLIRVDPGGGRRPGPGAVSAGACRRECSIAPATHRALLLRRSSEDRGQRSPHHACACPPQFRMFADLAHHHARHALELAQATVQARLATQIETEESARAAVAGDDRPHTDDGGRPREIESSSQGRIVAESQVGGLHHRYRRAA